MTFLHTVTPTTSDQNQSTNAWLTTTTGSNPLISCRPLKLPSACTWSLFACEGSFVCDAWVSVFSVSCRLLHVNACFCSSASSSGCWELHARIMKKWRTSISFTEYKTVGRRGRATDGGAGRSGTKSREVENQIRRKKSKWETDGLYRGGYAFMHWSVKSPAKGCADVNRNLCPAIFHYSANASNR